MISGRSRRRVGAAHRELDSGRRRPCRCGAARRPGGRRVGCRLVRGGGWHGQPSRPRSLATAMAAVVDGTASLAWAWARWVLMVTRLWWSTAAIRSLDLPRRQRQGLEFAQGQCDGWVQDVERGGGGERVGSVPIGQLTASATGGASRPTCRRSRRTQHRGRARWASPGLGRSCRVSCRTFGDSSVSGGDGCISVGFGCPANRSPLSWRNRPVSSIVHRGAGGSTRTIGFERTPPTEHEERRSGRSDCPATTRSNLDLPDRARAFCRASPPDRAGWLRWRSPRSQAASPTPHR